MATAANAAGGAGPAGFDRALWPEVFFDLLHEIADRRPSILQTMWPSSLRAPRDPANAASNLDSSVGFEH